MTPRGFISFSREEPFTVTLMLSKDSYQKLKAQLKIDEGLSLTVYRCPAGKLTIGYGRNIEDKGITINEPLASAWLDEDIVYFTDKLEKILPWFESLDEPRKCMLINMAFNLGLKNLLEFKNTLRALQLGDYEVAAKEMLQSKWAKQVGERALRLSNIMLTGNLS